MNLVDALSSFNARSVIELCLSPEFTRGHDSIARAIQDYPHGRNNTEAGTDHVSAQAVQQLRKYIPDNGDSCHFFALDVSACQRPYAAKLKEKQIVHKSNPTPGQKPIAVGHNLSCLGLVSTGHSWCLPVSLKRVPLDESQTDFGLQQAETVTHYFGDKNCIIASDAKYSHKEAISRAYEWRFGLLLSRLSPARVFYYQHDALGDRPGKQGRKKRYGEAFKLRDHASRDSAHAPDITTTIEHVTATGKQWQVTIDRFDDLIMKGSKACPMSEKPVLIYRISVVDHQGRKVYEQPLWLVGAGHPARHIDLADIFFAYNLRFNIEHWFRFSKQHLLVDKFQTCDTSHEENWWLFPLLATHMLFHSRHLADDYSMPWESNNLKGPASPSQVKRTMGKILRECGTPAQDSKVRGMGSGRKHGSKNATKRESSDIHFKTEKKPMAGSIIIKLPVDSIEGFSDARFSAHNLPTSGAVLKEVLQQAMNRKNDASVAV